MIRDSSLRYRWTRLAVLAGVLCACAPLPQRYLNSANPRYGVTEYMSDLSECRIENSTAVVIIVDYAVQPAAGVDEVKTDGCMSRRGWQPAPNSVSWLSTGAVIASRSGDFSTAAH